MLLPELESDAAYLLRTHFGDEQGWLALRSLIRDEFGDLYTQAQFIEDRDLADASPHDLLSRLVGNRFHSFVFIVDRAAVETADHAVVVMNLASFDPEYGSEPGRTFRAVPETLASIHANLSLANMDFEDYADSVDPDGVFRGFPVP